MKDIKSLYLSAKNSRRQQDIDAYSECVRDFLENAPYNYISNLEYIISSNIGLSTLKEFVDRNGISIGSYNEIMSHLAEGVKKCRFNGVSDAAYKESIAMMESFKQQYQNCFIMFESFQDKLGSQYIEAYYKNFPVLRKAESGKVNLSGIISRFGEACIPDMLIYTSKFGNPDVVLESLQSTPNTPVLYQWISESAVDIPNVSDIALVAIKEKSLQAIVESVKSRGTTLYRESVLTCNDEAVMEYSEEEIKAMEDLLSFKEYQITCMESTDDIMRIQSEIYDLYQEFAGLVEEDVADSVIPMLPGSNQKTSIMREGWLSNTMNKKTGEMPDYIKKNHDLSYGEDDHHKKELKVKPEDDTLDDFKRPSAEEDKTDKITPFDYSQDDKKKEEDHSTPEDKKHVNNFYYYTYQNSNNTHHNSNSFNRHTQDDHSVGKRVNSHDHGRGQHEAFGESVWTADELKLDPLTELTDLPADYYNIYHEATSTIITEANVILADRIEDDKGNDKAGKKSAKSSKEEDVRISEEKPGMIAKIKAMLMKLVDFLIEMYEKLFPRSILSFARLAKKFKKSEKLMKACRENGNILKIMEINIPHIIGVSRAFSDLVNYINIGAVPKGDMKSYQNGGTTRIVIYWGAYTGRNGKVDPDDPQFCVASNIPISDHGVRLKLRSLITIATFLSEDNLMKAFGIKVKNHRGGDMSLDDLRLILKYTKNKINLDLKLWKNREDREKLLTLLKAITEVTDNVYRTMNKSFRIAANMLKDAEAGKFETDVPMAESAPWELNVFNDDLYTEGLGGTNLGKSFRGYDELRFTEAVGDADDKKPTDDDPIQNAMVEIDRKLAGAQQSVKKKVQGVMNTGKTIIKPFKRTSQWISSMVAYWKDSNENDIKERLADPHARSNLFKAVRTAIKYGSLMKAGLLLNPIILFLTLGKKWNNGSKEFRLRNEMIGELKAELEIIDEKIKDADRAGDNKAKYQLMRFKNELNKKLIRVGGSKGMAKMV